MNRSTRLLAASAAVISLIATGLFATSPAEARSFFRPGFAYPFYPRPVYLPPTPPFYVVPRVAYIPPPPIAYGYGYGYGYRYRYRRVAHHHYHRVIHRQWCSCYCCR